jgi:hypothetical protein
VPPFKVNLVRGKKLVPYHVTLFEDACEALRALYAERVQKTGGKVESLFQQWILEMCERLQTVRHGIYPDT